MSSLTLYQRVFSLNFFCQILILLHSFSVFKFLFFSFAFSELAFIFSTQWSRSMTAPIFSASTWSTFPKVLKMPLWSYVTQNGMIRKSIHSIIILYNALLGGKRWRGEFKKVKEAIKLDTGVLKLKPEIIKRGSRVLLAPWILDTRLDSELYFLAKFSKHPTKHCLKSSKYNALKFPPKCSGWHLWMKMQAEHPCHNTPVPWF